MNENYPTRAVADETDCLQAIGAFKSFKNLMFLVSFICLALLQTAFWMNYLDLIDATDCSCPEPLGVPTEVVAEASVVEQAAAATSETPTCGNQAGIFGINAIISSVAKPTCGQMFCIIAVCNCVLFVAVILFSLNLLMSLKISIVGRLGGLNHIARAFLLSLFLLVLIVPWQVCLPDTVVGAIYTADELFCAEPVTCADSLADCLFYFGRFTGLWAVVTILLIAAQIRSMCWTKAVGRKLRVLK